MLSDIEEHLKCTITQCEPDIKVPVDDFDGKVTYGQRRALGGRCLSDDRPRAAAAPSYAAQNVNWMCFVCLGGNYKGHVDVLAPTVQELANLEREAQSSFLHLGFLPNQLFKSF